ncbi:hypothetical protein [Rhodoflexus sp.]
MKPHLISSGIMAALFSLLVCYAVFAQFSGNVNYQDSDYAYDINPIKPNKGTYQLTINTVPPQAGNRPIYQSLMRVTGEVAANKKLVITVLRASIEREKWVLNRESLLEATFDYAAKKVVRTTKGSFAQFRTPEYGEVVADKVTPQTIDLAKAIDYVVQDLIVNYNKIMAPHTATNTVSGVASGKTKLTIVPQMAVFPVTIAIQHKDTNYKINVGQLNPQNRRQDIQIKIVEQNEEEDAGSTSTLFTSYLIIEDKVAGKDADWIVRIHYAERTNNFTWQPYPSQFLECKFSAARGAMIFNPSAKLLPFQSNNPAKIERLEGTDGQITKDELLKTAITHFVKHYSKLFAKQ